MQQKIAENTKEKEYDFTETREIGGLPDNFNVKDYVGRTTKIAGFLEKATQYGPAIILYTENLTTEKDKRVVASRLFGLAADEKKKVFWKPQSKLGVFLKKQGVNHYFELIGKEVMVTFHTSGDGKDYLTFG